MLLLKPQQNWIKVDFRPGDVSGTPGGPPIPLAPLSKPADPLLMHNAR
jgi:hypothetical protein